MKIIGMLSYFDEDPALLRESVSRVADLVDVLVAVDGPYALLETDKTMSPIECQHAIFDAALAIKKPWRDRPALVLRGPTGWEGNEVEKRNYMLSLALEIAEEGDWLLVFDADHMWERAHEWMDLGHELSLASSARESSCAGEIAFADCSLDEPSPSWYEARLLLRAVEGMRYEGAHWRVRFPDGRAVSTLKAGDPQIDEPAGIIRLNDSFRVRHVKYGLAPEREARQASYYGRRDAGEGIER